MDLHLTSVKTKLHFQDGVWKSGLIKERNQLM